MDLETVLNEADEAEEVILHRLGIAEGLRRGREDRQTAKLALQRAEEKARHLRVRSEDFLRYLADRNWKLAREASEERKGREATLFVALSLEKKVLQTADLVRRLEAKANSLAAEREKLRKEMGVLRSSLADARGECECLRAALPPPPPSEGKNG